MAFLGFWMIASGCVISSVTTPLLQNEHGNGAHHSASAGALSWSLLQASGKEHVYVRRDDRLTGVEVDDAKVVSPWPRFIGIGDGDGGGETGFVAMNEYATVAKCGTTIENSHDRVTEQYMGCGFRRAGIRLAAHWEMACCKYNLKHNLQVSSFGLYPMRLEQIQSNTNHMGVQGECYNGGFVALISLKPVLELYCKTGFPDYKHTWVADLKYGGWITCDTLLLPTDEVKLFSLQESISRGTYNPVVAEEWVGCVCEPGSFMFAYRASKHLVDANMLLSMEIKCAKGTQWGSLR